MIHVFKYFCKPENIHILHITFLDIEILDLKNYIEERYYKSENNLYQLMSISNHSGSSYSSGHYTACYLTDNNKYYYFDDTDILK